MSRGIADGDGTTCRPWAHPHDVTLWRNRNSWKSQGPFNGCRTDAAMDARSSFMLRAVLSSPSSAAFLGKRHVGKNRIFSAANATWVFTGGDGELLEGLVEERRRSGRAELSTFWNQKRTLRLDKAIMVNFSMEMEYSSCGCPRAIMCFVILIRSFKSCHQQNQFIFGSFKFNNMFNRLNSYRAFIQ
ncbi:hypothetical protein OPV22_023802 [Ensete ventricosum]|uniref:Uncharacterized protein n=1 Tax=Ensete ventricosum TaxID=4639 RepID=A0AAV8QPE2_ENSVE|nr:hypothetical protein OPV22_023802 [Ensete ventricosum]